MLTVTESGSASSVPYDCNLDAISPVDVLASIQSRATDSADRQMTSRSLGLREMMRCATSAAARAVNAIGGLESRTSAGGLDPRQGPSAPEVRPVGGMIPLGYGPGLESRPPVGLDPRTGLEVRNASGMDTRSVGGMEPRTVGLGIEMRDAVTEREEVVISTLSWPPDQRDNINQGKLCFVMSSMCTKVSLCFSIMSKEIAQVVLFSLSFVLWLLITIGKALMLLPLSVDWLAGWFVC